MSMPAKKRPSKLELNVLLFEEDKAWVAQCLQFDVAEQGPTPDAAMANWVAAFAGQAAANREDGKSPLHGLPQAPSPLWVLLRQRCRRDVRPKDVSVELSRRVGVPMLLRLAVLAA